MLKKESNLTSIMLVQQFEDEHWEKWSNKSEIRKAKQGDCKPLGEELLNKLDTNGITVTELYCIIHDSDDYNVWNSEKLQIENKKQKLHGHFLFKFKKGITLNKLAYILEVEPQYLEKLKSGRYGYENCLAYLVHAKDESKFQYPPERVITLRGEDYLSIYHRNIEKWLKGRATKKVIETKFSLDWIIQEILEEKITKKDILLNDEYYSIYGQYKRKINEALDTAGERKGYKTQKDLETGKFKKTILYVFGDSGTGKTIFGKKVIEKIINISSKYEKKWSHCLTASTNAFDEYNSEEILFLDDIRGDSLTVSDWLKLLDPYMISPISARYHNKVGSAKVIIITSTKKPTTFFYNVKDNYNEDLGQFLRRIDYFIEIKDEVLLSVPIKSEEEIYTYEIRLEEIINKEMALNKLIAIVEKNMNWDNKTVRGGK